MTKASTLNVYLYNEQIGTIVSVDHDRSLFSFSEGYANNNARPILSLGFKDFMGDLISDFRLFRTKLLPFFSNLLPEEHMREYLAKRAGVNPVREFYLLWALGHDLPQGSLAIIDQL